MLAGNEEPFPGEPRRYFAIVGLSPDGTRLAYTVEGDDQMPEIWVMDLDTGGTRRRSAPGTPAFGGGWLPDGRLVFINFEDFSTSTLMVTEMRRNAEPEPLFPDGLGDESLEMRGEPAIAPDGTMIYLTVVKDDRETDIYVRPMDGSAPAQPFLATAAMERRPRVSPDGRWLAFVSDESGRTEVYVRPVDDAANGDDRIKRISRTGGSRHFWSVDGKQIFFQHEEALHVVDIDTTGEDLEAGAPRVLFDSNDLEFSWRASFTPMPDGERLLFVKSNEDEDGNPSKGRRVHVILNWIEELEWTESLGSR
jgi:Tol biopolymer transport system component